MSPSPRACSAAMSSRSLSSRQAKKLLEPRAPEERRHERGLQGLPLRAEQTSRVVHRRECRTVREGLAMG